MLLCDKKLIETRVVHIVYSVYVRRPNSSVLACSDFSDNVVVTESTPVVHFYEDLFEEAQISI